MKKTLTALGILAMVFFLLPACQKEVASKKELKPDQERSALQQTALQTITTTIPCGTPLVKDLLDMGGTVDWGDIIISNDNDHITVQVNSALPGMFIKRITVLYGTLEHITDFQTNPITWTPCEGPVQYDRQKNYVPTTTFSDTVQISNTRFLADNCIWLSVQVHLMNESGSSGCAFAFPYDGEVIGSAQWQSAFRYCKQDCPPPGDCGQLRTQTPGGWGAPPSGNNPGTYLHANFAGAFPNGLTVGCTPSFNVHLTSAQAITDLLPTGGQAVVLTQNYNNPAAIKNVLVGHLVALTLSTGFDVYDPAFGQAGIGLGQMEIGSGPFAG